MYSWDLGFRVQEVGSVNDRVSWSKKGQEEAC